MQSTPFVLIRGIWTAASETYDRMGRQGGRAASAFVCLEYYREVLQVVAFVELNET